MKRGWVIALSVVAGAGVLIWLGKKASAAAAASAATGPSDEELPGAGDGSDAMYVPVVSGGKDTGGAVLWTSTDAQSKLVGPRMPDYFDAEGERFVFADASGSGYTWIQLDSTGRVTASGKG